MTQEEIEELKQLIGLQRELTRQRLRTATCEAWVDDVQQKMAINRAVYAAGYGIAPTVNTKTETVTKTETTQDTPQPAQQPSPAQSLGSRLMPWIVAGSLALGGAGTGAWMLNRPDESPAVTPGGEFEIPRYDVEKWTPAK